MSHGYHMQDNWSQNWTMFLVRYHPEEDFWKKLYLGMSLECTIINLKPRKTSAKNGVTFLRQNLKKFAHSFRQERICESFLRYKRNNFEVPQNLLISAIKTKKRGSLSKGILCNTPMCDHVERVQLQRPYKIFFDLPLSRYHVFCLLKEVLNGKIFQTID